VGSNGEHNTDGGRFDDRTKGLCEINAATLVEAFGDQASLELLDSTIWLAFHLVNPLVANNVVIPGSEAERPSAIV
jgi:hypothetical protein